MSLTIRDKSEIKCLVKIEIERLGYRLKELFNNENIQIENRINYYIALLDRLEHES